MIDDDSNELIPFEGGDGDADANTGNNNPDDTQSVTIIQDEQGIVFLGDAGTIDLWLKDEGFDSKAFTAKAVQTISSASKGAQAAGNAMAESGRWVKLTKESAELVAKYGKNCKKGPFQAGVARQPNGRIIKHLQFTQPGQLNPAMLTGVSGVMAQMALEQAVSEITDYLKEIDAKLDDLLRDQKDQTVSKLAGISHMIDETMLIYQQVGSISETTWSKMSGCPQDIATIQVCDRQNQGPHREGGTRAGSQAGSPADPADSSGDPPVVGHARIRSQDAGSGLLHRARARMPRGA